MRTAICIGIVAVFAICLACGRTPTQPASVQKTPPAITAIRINGPTAIAPGATGQFTAIAQRSDGSSEDVTATATWRAIAPQTVLRIIGAGMAQAGTRGEGTVQVDLGATRATLAVLVLEPGTFRVSGTVTETGGPVIGNAAIEIVSGTGTGLRTTSNYQGHYALYGAAGDVQLRASGDGFEQQVRGLVVADNAANDFNLRPLVTPADLSGSWILTVSAAPRCRAILPEVALERAFDAAITQQGTNVHITLTSPTISRTSGTGCTTAGCGPLTVDGRIFGQALSFVLMGDTYYGYDLSVGPDLLERLSPTQWLGITGSVEGTVTGSEIHAVLDGRFEYSETAATATRPANSVTACHGKDSGVILRRR